MNATVNFWFKLGLSPFMDNRDNRYTSFPVIRYWAFFKYRDITKKKKKENRSKRMHCF